MKIDYFSLTDRTPFASNIELDGEASIVMCSHYSARIPGWPITRIHGIPDIHTVVTFETDIFWPARVIKIPEQLRS